LFPAHSRFTPSGGRSDADAFQQGAGRTLTNNAGSDRYNGSQQPKLLQMVNTLLQVYRFEAGRKI